MLRGLALLLIAGAVLAPGAQAAPRNGAIFYTEGSALKKVRPDASHAATVGDSFAYDRFGFAPGGRELVGVGNDGLSVLDAFDGSRIHRVPVDGEWLGRPDWRPTGREIAFSKCERSVFTDIDECVSYGVYRARPDGSHVRRVAQGSDPSWAGDGRSIVFLHQLKQRDPLGNRCTGIYEARADGKRLRPILPRPPRCSSGLDAPHNASIGFDGRRIVFLLRDGIWTVGTDGSRAVHIFKPRRGYYVRDVRWSPDGRLIAYMILREHGPSRGAIYVTGETGGRGHQVAKLLDIGGSIAWQPIASRR